MKNEEDRPEAVGEDGELRSLWSADFLLLTTDYVFRLPFEGSRFTPLPSVGERRSALLGLRVGEEAGRREIMINCGEKDTAIASPISRSNLPGIRRPSSVITTPWFCFITVSDFFFAMLRRKEIFEVYFAYTTAHLPLRTEPQVFFRCYLFKLITRSAVSFPELLFLFPGSELRNLF